MSSHVPEELSSAASGGRLIVNADDWGRDRENTDRILDCVRCGAVSSVSAMVFMEDSGRAARIAVDQGIDAGLHLNLTTAFSAPGIPGWLAEHQGRIVQYFERRRLGQLRYHPGLADSFKCVVGAQIEEYARLFGRAVARIDGHHHMHLSTNVLVARLLPAGATVRRNFTFRFGEKSVFNITYRKIVDSILSQRHRITDYLFSLTPIDRGRLQRIFGLAEAATVEVETHPVNPDEFHFLTGGGLFSLAGKIPVARGYTVR